MEQEPNLKVIGFCGGEAHVPGAKQHGAVVQAQFVKNSFGIFGQSFVLFVALLRVRKLEELDFLKLMLAENAAGVFPGGSGLRAKASRPCGDIDRQFFFRDGLVAIKVVKLDLGCGGEPEVRAFKAK